MPAPDVPLTRVDGSSATASDLMGASATVFVFWSNQCPWVDRYEDRIQSVASDFRGEGVRFVLVNANDATTFPKENLEASRERADAADYDVTYVRDDDARLAEALGASRTPHVFVFDDANTLVYAGAVDDSPASADNVEKPYLRNALQAVTSGESVSVADTKAFGCTLKSPN
jgi:thiol-disulfide isomerase/thioredoxin